MGYILKNGHDNKYKIIDSQNKIKYNVLMNIVGILAIISPVGIAFAIYVYFANKRIKNKLSEDEELKNSKKGAFLDSLRIGLVIEAAFYLLKIHAFSAFGVLLVIFGVSLQNGHYYTQDIKLIVDIISSIVIICIALGLHILIKQSMMRPILKDSGHKLKFREMFPGLIVSSFAGITILIIEYIILSVLSYKLYWIVF